MELRGKKVLVTGSEGFIGSHLVERLIKAGCVVRAFVFYNFTGSWGWLEGLPPAAMKKVEIFTGDVRDPGRVREATKGIDIVFHLAALIGIPFSYHSPESYIDTNIKGTLNILQAVRETGAKKVLVTSTSEIYGTARRVPIDETHPRQGQSPYSASKIGADYIAESFYRSFGMPVVIVRPFNTYGPRQSARAVIPTVITQLLAGERRIRLGALNPTRDFVYVKDTADGFIEIAKSNATIGQEINIATETEISIGNLTKQLIKMINPRARIVTDDARLRPAKSEVERLCGSNDKIRRLTDWRPEYSLARGLEETVKWFGMKGRLKLYKPHRYNV